MFFNSYAVYDLFYAVLTMSKVYCSCCYSKKFTYNFISITYRKKTSQIYGSIYWELEFYATSSISFDTIFVK